MVSYSPLPRRQSGSTNATSTGHHFALAIVAHIVFILLFIVVIIVGITVDTTLPASWVMDSGKWYKGSSLLSMIISVFGQIIGSGYAALLVYITQGFALRRELYTPQTLSAIHEKSNAWMGLVPSITTLWRQILSKGKMGGWRVALIVFYLAVVFAVHPITSALFEVTSFNSLITIPDRLMTSQAKSIEDISELPIEAFTIMPSFPLLNANSSLIMSIEGLKDNVVHDIIVEEPNSTARLVSVNGLYFDVDCGYVQATQNGPMVRLENETMYFPLKFNSTIIEDATFQASFDTFTTLSDIRLKSWPIDRQKPTTIFMATTANVVGGAGGNETRTSINPPISNGTESRKDILVLGCNVLPYNVTVWFELRSGKKKLQYMIGLPSSTNSPWKDWKEWSLPSNMTTAVAAPWVYNISQISPRGVSTWSIYVDNTEMAISASAFDLFFTNLIRSYSNWGCFPLRGQFCLSDVNKNLAKVVAALYWFAGNQNPSAGKPATVRQSETCHMLQINVFIAIAGTLLGATLLILFLILALHGLSPNAGRLDTSGVLQISWIAAKNPHILKELQSIDEPVIDTLRKTGTGIVVDLSTKPDHLSVYSEELQMGKLL